MKFVLLTIDYPPARGGVATYYAGLVGALREAGHEVQVVTQGLLSRWVIPRWAVSFLTLWKIIKKDKPDFFIVGQILPLGAAPFLFRKRVPYIVATHGMDLAMAANVSRKKYLATKIVEGAQLVTANSEFTANLVRRFGVPRERMVILHPCPQSLIAASQEQVAEVRATLGLTGKRVLLSVGRLVARKGFDTLIDAMPAVLAKHPNVVLVIGGDGAERDALAMKIATHKIQGSVRMVGAIDNETLTALYQVADIFAMPCRAIGADVEGFGIVYLEAGIFGVPSIAGKSGGANEAVIDGKTGVVVEPTAEKVAQAIDELLSNDELRKTMGKAAKEFAATFSWKENVRKLFGAL